jgi:hypothetical protein
VPNATTQEIKEWETLADDQAHEAAYNAADPVAASRRQQPAVAAPKVPTPAEVFGGNAK